MSMNAIIGALRVVLGMDSASFNDGATAAEKRVADMQRSFRRVGQSMQRTGAMMSAAVTAPLVGIGTQAVQNFRAQEAAVAQVEAALASMGDGAGYTLEQLQAMASGLQEASLYGDEDILGKVTANLLTFGNIQGEVFADAQQMALDLSARLGTDLQSSAVMLGKALNDPVQGLTALTRVGVSFDEATKEQIRTMAEAGDVAGAQSVMLAELQRQYAGQAAALAAADGGKITQMWNAIGDALEHIGAVILPVVADIAVMVKGWAEAFQALEPETKKFIVIAGAVAAAIGPVLVGLGLAVTAMAPLAGVIAAVVGPIGLAAAAVGVLGVAVYRNWDQVRPALEPMIDLFERVKPVLGQVAKVWAGAALDWIETLGGVLTGVVDMTGAILSGDWAGAWRAGRDVVETMLRGMFRVVDQVTGGALSRLGATLNGALSGLRAWSGGAFEAVAGWWGSARSAVGGLAAATAERAGQLGQDVRAAVESATGVVRSALAGDWAAAWQGAGDYLANVGSVIWSALDLSMHGLPSLLWAKGSELLGQFRDGMTGRIASVSSVFAGLWGRLDVQLGGWPERLRLKAVDLMDRFREGAAGGIVGVVGVYLDLWADIWAEVSTWPNKFIEIGGHLVDGLKQGISEKWEQFKGWFTGLASGLVSAVNGVFGIQSPSRVFAQIGEFLVEGLVMGIDRRADDATASAGALAEAVTDATDLSGAFGGVGDAVEQMEVSTNSAFESMGRNVGDLIQGVTTLGDLFASNLIKMGQSELQAGLGSISALFGGGGFGDFMSGLAGSLIGFQNGGSFEVGGVGGTDSQVVSFRATPGEMVDVRTPGQVAAERRAEVGGGAFDVRVFVDDNGNLDAKIDRVAGQHVANKMRVADAALPGRIGRINHDPRRG